MYEYIYINLVLLLPVYQWELWCWLSPKCQGRQKVGHDPLSKTFFSRPAFSLVLSLQCLELMKLYTASEKRIETIYEQSVLVDLEVVETLVLFLCTQNQHLREVT